MGRYSHFIPGTHINGILITPHREHKRSTMWWRTEASKVGGGPCGKCGQATYGEYMLDSDGSWVRRAVVERCRTCGWLAYHWTQEQSGPIERHKTRGPQMGTMAGSGERIRPPRTPRTGRNGAEGNGKRVADGVHDTNDDS